MCYFSLHFTASYYVEYALDCNGFSISSCSNQISIMTGRIMGLRLVCL